MRKVKKFLFSIGIVAILFFSFFLPILVTKIEDQNLLLDTKTEKLQNAILENKSKIAIGDKLRMVSMMDTGITLRSGRYLEEEEAFYRAKLGINILREKGVSFVNGEWELIDSAIYYVIDQYNIENRMIVWEIEVQNDFQNIRMLLDDETGEVLGVICRNNELKDNHDDNTEEGEPAEHEGVSVSTAKTLTSAFSEYWGVEFLNVVLGDDGKYRLIMRDNETVELMLSVQNSSFRINFK